MSADRSSRGLLAALVVAAPVLVGAGYALLGALGVVGAGAAGEPGLERLVRVLSDPAVWRGVAWSIWVAAASTLLATAGAVLLATTLRGDGRLDRWGRALALFPLPVPHVVAGVIALLLLGQSGLLARGAHALGWVAAPGEVPALVYDRAGVGLILALAWKEVPFLALIAFSVLAGRGTALEETARTLGAGQWELFRRVTWPVLWRGLLPAVVAVFAFAVGSFELAALLAPSDPLALPLQTMERYTDSALERRGDAFVLVLLALAISLAAVAVHERVRRSREELEW